jgi:hypothetical protein
MRAGALAFACLLLAGCSGATTVLPEGYVARHYLGYVKLVVPDRHSTSAGVSASDVKALGVRIENGVGIGYFHDQQVITPLDCHVVVLVRNEQQLRDAVERLTTSIGEDLCAAVYPAQ